MSFQVAPERTPHSMEEIRSLLREVYQNRTAEPWLLALLANEHRNGEAVWNNNFGNLILGGNKDFSWYELPGNDRIWRSAATPKMGMLGFVNNLKSRHPQALAAAERGDGYTFGQLIADQWVVASPEERGPLIESYIRLARDFGATRQSESLAIGYFAVAVIVGALFFAVVRSNHK